MSEKITARGGWCVPADENVYDLFNKPGLISLMQEVMMADLADCAPATVRGGIKFKCPLAVDDA